MKAIRNIVLSIIDFFHKPFAKWIDTTTFRYLACGGSNQVLYIFLYWLSYNFLLAKHDVHFPFLTVTAPIAAYIIAFTVSFPIGFTLSRHIVFPESNLHGRVQFFRYVLLTGMCILLTYLFLKFFVEWCHFYPTPSSALTSAIIAIFSFVSQKHFTFKVKEHSVSIIEVDEEGVIIEPVEVPVQN
ncbi:GtrA family protein [Taibaiella soli]|uniref:GtrA family protein n=1 Tax=Taibaiella soli TaxID=1649169 RepID=UPI001FB4F556|nr:GtrA family protein [Taibaiella soli]